MELLEPIDNKTNNNNLRFDDIYFNDKKIKQIIKIQKLFRDTRIIDRDYVKKIINFPYKIDDFQLHSIESIEKKQHVLVTAHTSAGKSTIAEFSIAKCGLTNKKVIYTSPIKTLSNQKYYDLKHKSTTLLNMRPEDIGIMTGDVKINSDNAQCTIMTTEILRNKLYKDLEYFEDVDIVVFDEVHYIKDIDRGHVWEEAIIMMPKHITIVMLSATLSNPREFADWVQHVKGRKTNLVSTLYRPVPLRFYLFAEEKLYPLITSDKKINSKSHDIVKKYYIKYYKDRYSSKALFNELSSYLHIESSLPAILFCFSRKNCEIYSKYITITLNTHEDRTEIEHIFNKHITKNMSESDRNLPQTLLIKSNLMKGIGIHHSGLLPLLKEIIEILFGKGLIKMLFATETFAVGVNMPAKTVIFTELEKYDNHHGRRNLFTDEFLQISGRAGRRGLDTEGKVIYMPLKDMTSKCDMQSIMLGATPVIVSKFRLDQRLILKSIESSEQDLCNIIENSLINNEILATVKANKREIDILQNSITTNNLSNDEKILVNNYLKEQRDGAVKKKKLRLNNIRDKWTSDKTIFDNIIASEEQNNKRCQDIKYYERETYNVINSASIKIHQLLIYLKRLNYIKFDDEYMNKITDKNAKYFMRTLKEENLTKKGLICCQLNECNGILMSEIIEMNVFNDLDELTIVCILAIFIGNGNGKSSEENGIYLDDLEIPKEIKKHIETIMNVSNKLDVESHNYNINYDFVSDLSFIEYVYGWYSGKSLIEIYSTMDEKNKIYEGNFVKNILKIISISTEIITTLEIINDHEIINKFINIEKKLHRDIVGINSLYLS
jgi:superfamily II RNA helicase